MTRPGHPRSRVRSVPARVWVPVGLVAVVTCVAVLRAAGLFGDAAVLAGLVAGAMVTVPLTALLTAQSGQPATVRAAPGRVLATLRSTTGGGTPRPPAGR